MAPAAAAALLLAAGCGPPAEDDERWWESVFFPRLRAPPASPSPPLHRASPPGALQVSSLEPVAKDPPREWPPLQTSVPLYDLRIARDDLDRLYADPTADVEVPGEFDHAGRTWAVLVELRGRTARLLPKKSFDVKFPKDDLFEGRRRLALVAEYRDGGVLTEKLWYDLAAAAGLRVPRARFVELRINGRVHGVMTELEKVDKRFLAAHGLDPDGDVYRCGHRDCELRDGPPEPYQFPWEKQTNEAAPWDELHEFLRRINRAPPGDCARVLSETLDVRAYARWLAVDAAIGNRSVEDSRSYLLYDRRTARWTYVPWDLNNAVSIYDRAKGTDAAPRTDRALKAFTAYDPWVWNRADSRDRRAAFSVLSTRLLDDPALRAVLVEELRNLLDREFRESVLGPRADALEAQLAPHLARDPWIDPAYPPLSAEYLRRWVRERRDYLVTHLGALARHGDNPLVLDRVGRADDGRWFVQLFNRAGATARPDGWLLTGWLRQPEQWMLDGVAVPGEGHVTLLQGASQPAERLGAVVDPAYPEVGLFRAGSPVPVDVLYLPVLGPGEAIGRVPRGSESFEARDPGPLPD